MCTLLLRVEPAARWPVQVGAIRDEFVERSWDPPAQHWPEPWARFVGGRDHTAGGTWLAVDPSPERPAVAALLNGFRRDPLPDGGARPTRGTLALRVLAGEGLPDGEALEPYDRFHVVLATRARQEVWTWDGDALHHRDLDPGVHIVVNAGLDDYVDPLVPHFLPLLEAVDAADDQGWGGWPGLLTGDGLAGDHEAALIVAKDIEGRRYGTTSGALVAIGADGQVRYDFSADPADPAAWEPVVRR
ncbi:MAG: NRDE family protein [Actinomycetota bacterium]|nr:NRDE family protein [Actinomycetota bacterium]